MNENPFSHHWAQAQFCYFRAEATSNAVIKHLWIQLAQDWIALSQDFAPKSEEQTCIVRLEKLQPVEAA